MVLTNAERQKKWREKRKSQNLEAFLAEERERKRKAYISVSELSEKELKKRRQAESGNESPITNERKGKRKRQQGILTVTILTMKRDIHTSPDL